MTAKSPGWSDFSKSCNGRHVNINQRQGDGANYHQDRVRRANHQARRRTEQEPTSLTARPARRRPRTRRNRTRTGEGQLLPLRAPPLPAIARSESKAGGLYRNSTWDLVDRMKEKDFDITKIKDEDLCEEMKKLKPEERLLFLKKKAEERAELRRYCRHGAPEQQKTRRRTRQDTQD